MQSQPNNQEMRFERIAQIRRQIAAGTYETPERLELAVEAFLDCHSDGGRPTRQEEN